MITNKIHYLFSVKEMPKDKTLSHIKVNNAIREEFLEKGFEAASIRSIGARAGMTSAGLYRHYPDKEAMFAAMVEPLLCSIREWTERHSKRKYQMVDNKAGQEELFGETVMDLIKKVILPQREAFLLLMTKSAGTKYADFVHDFVMQNQKMILDALKYLKKKGYPVLEVDEEEVHILLSAYVTACFETILHHQEEAKINRHLDTIHQFFMPGWLRIMGVS